jgi:two-component sensor histidine kinase/PAS domain-containing protein
MSKHAENSNFKTQLEPEKQYKNAIWMYLIVAVLVIPMFGGALYFSDYPIWFVYTIFGFLFCLIVLITASFFRKHIKKKLVLYTSFLLFLSIVSFFSCLCYNAFDLTISFCFLVSYVFINLTLKEYKVTVYFSAVSFVMVLVGLIIYQPSQNIWFLLLSMMFFSGAISILVAKRIKNIVDGLHRETAFMAEILNNTGIGYILLNKKSLTISDCNTEAIKILGFNDTLIKEEYLTIFKEQISSFDSQKIASFEIEVDQKIFEFNLRLFIQTGEEFFLFKFNNITEKRDLDRLKEVKKDQLLGETQKELETQLLKLNSIYEHSPDIFIWNVNKHLEIVSYNNYFLKELEESINRTVEKNIHFDDLFGGRITDFAATNFKKIMLEVLKNGTPKTIEGKLFDKDRKATWFETYITPIFNQKKEVYELICISHNTTAKKENEEKLTSLSKEQETLLQEIHHRVKNNLQVISSILNLQSTYVSDEGTLEILKESQNRIKSMSFIHESLYMNNDFSSINFNDYILNLINNLVHSYQIFDNQVNVKTDLKIITLGLDQSITCGLLLNEIISNAFKHAFPDKDKIDNELIITASESNNNVRILVADNGIGLREEMIPEENNSLGMQLIYTLIEQLDGNIQLTGENGTKYLITFEKQN